MTNKIDIRGLSHREAVEVIKSQSGTKYDPEIVDILLKVNKDKD